jgi:CelD/BcsL family acetyltransferase involved in cellulose biosynthesis
MDGERARKARACAEAQVVSDNTAKPPCASWRRRGAASRRASPCRSLSNGIVRAVAAGVRTITTAAELEALAGRWDELVLAMPRPSPFLLHGWVTEWWRHLGDGARLAVSVAERDGVLVGAVPLAIRRQRGLRVARFLGDHESALGDLLLAPDEPIETADALLDAVERQPFDLLDVFGLPGGSRLATAAGGSDMAVIERVEAPVLDMPNGWEAAYAAKTGSKKRNLHRRRLRQLSGLGEVAWTVAVNEDELLSGLEECFRLHELRWAGRPDGSTFGTPEGQRFHRAALRAIAPARVPRMVILRVAGRPVACHYYFALAQTMYVHRLAFDPDPALARFSPGLVCTLKALETASEQGLTRVEYLGGDERYKVELSDRLEPLYEGIGLGQNPVAKLAVRQRLAVISARRRLKRSAAVHRLYVSGLAPLRKARAAVARRPGPS